MSSLSYRAVLRLFKSSFLQNWLKKLTFTERADLLIKFWRSAERHQNVEQRFKLIQESFTRQRMGTLSLVSSNEYGRAYGFFDLVGSLRDVEGDIVECGVGRGISFAYLVYAVALHKLDKTVYGFDSFAGFPPAAEQDLGSRVKEANRRPEGWTETSPEMIKAVFDHDLPLKDSLIAVHPVNYKLIPGFFDQSLPGNLPPKIALLHADADMYPSTLAILTHGLPRMASGGVVIFDEYHEERWPGVRKAVEEICTPKGLQVEYFEKMRRYGLRIP